MYKRQREALEIFRQLGDRVGEAIGLLHLGQIGVYLGEHAQARLQLEKCLAIAREIRHQEIEGECELALGETAFELGDRAQARLWFARSLSVCLDAGDKRGEANALRWLGRADLQDGDSTSARNRLGDALRAFRAFEMREELLSCLEDHVALAHAEGNVDVAVRLAAAAARSRERLGLVRAPRSEQRWQAELDRLRQAISVTDFDAGWVDGWDWQVDHAISSAVSTRAELIMV